MTDIMPMREKIARAMKENASTTNQLVIQAGAGPVSDKWPNPQSIRSKISLPLSWFESQVDAALDALMDPTDAMIEAAAKTIEFDALDDRMNGGLFKANEPATYLDKLFAKNGLRSMLRAAKEGK